MPMFYLNFYVHMQTNGRAQQATKVKHPCRTRSGGLFTDERQETIYSWPQKADSATTTPRPQANDPLPVFPPLPLSPSLIR